MKNVAFAGYIAYAVRPTLRGRNGGWSTGRASRWPSIVQFPILLLLLLLLL